jgi:REP element-mobilizing transposase RayT
MSLPREVLPGQFYMITRRCQQRLFLLRPDTATNNAFTYCLIEAAQRTQLEVLVPCAMSNHYHAVVFDRYGRYPEFVEHFHKMFARSQNALRGRWENFWSCEPVCVVKLVGREAVMDKLVYTATNPVQDHLVERVHHWPGVNGLPALMAGRPVHATRPLHFFRPEGPMPRAVEMRLTIRPSSGGSRRCSGSCGIVFARWRPTAPGSDSVPAGGCLADAPCWRSRGAASRQVTSLAGTCDRV